MTLGTCVYCSSSDRIDPRYFAVAEDLGRRIGQGEGTLVYGGGKLGLMGAVARATHAAGGRVVGVIPQGMVDVEVAYHDADELIVTETMRQRKAIMEERAGGFVVLPGGFGTLEELLEMLVLRVLGYHDKPVVLLNCFGFYDDLLELFDRLYADGFARPKDRPLYEVASDPAEALHLAQRGAGSGDRGSGAAGG